MRLEQYIVKAGIHWFAFETRSSDEYLNFIGEVRSDYYQGVYKPDGILISQASVQFDISGSPVVTFSIGFEASNDAMLFRLKLPC